jgi:hypothetical protein
LRTDIDIDATEAAWAPARKVELRRTLLALAILVVLEIAGALIVGGRVDS